MSVTEYYQKLMPWLMEPLGQSNCCYLEMHRELLDDGCEQLLTSFISEHHDQPDELRRLRIRQMLLRDARTRGGTEQAIQAAYVNMCGGLVLHLPAWLLDVERHITCLTQAQRSERIIATCKMRLSNAIDYARVDQQVAPETVAELYYQLGLLFVAAALSCTQHTLEKAIGYYQEALHTYTPAVYPLQYAKVLMAMGNAHLCNPLSPWPHLLDRASQLYQRALQSYHGFLASTLPAADEVPYRPDTPVHLSAR